MISNKKILLKNIIENLQLSNLDAYLIYDNSIQNSDLYYITNFKSEDPFFYIITKKEIDIILISDMEKNRVLKESNVTNILTYSDFTIKKNINRDDFIIDILHQIFYKYNIYNIGIPKNFPSILYFLLTKKNKYKYSIIKSPIKKEREIKNKEEIKYIKQSVNAAEFAMKTTIEKLKKLSIKDNLLYDKKNRAITGEDIRKYIDQILIKKSCYSFSTIVSCGVDTENPHGTTNSVLKPNEPIIIDIFPRSIKTLYYGDMTRTVVRGNASEKLKDIYNTVKEAQEEGIKMIKPNITCIDIHNKVCDIIERKGYHTIRNCNENIGFNHSTGHGVGLDIHENPNVSDSNYKLKEGNVITIEPGLYYPKIGGVRIEDTIYVTKKGYKNLNKYEKIFEI